MCLMRSSELLNWFDLMWSIWFDFIPLCLNRKFQNMFNAQLRTYQPPIPNSSQASAWSYMYIGRWMCKTECSPTGLGKKFVRLNGWKIPRQKWSISCLWEHFLVPEHQIQIWLGFKLMANGKSLIFHWFYWYFEFMNQSQLQKCFKFLRFFNKNLTGVSINSPKSLIFHRLYYDFEWINQS